MCVFLLRRVSSISSHESLLKRFSSSPHCCFSMSSHLRDFALNITLASFGCLHTTPSSVIDARDPSDTASINSCENSPEKRTLAMSRCPKRSKNSRAGIMPFFEDIYVNECHSVLFFSVPSRKRLRSIKFKKEDCAFPLFFF